MAASSLDFTPSALFTLENRESVAPIGNARQTIDRHISAANANRAAQTMMQMPAENERRPQRLQCQLYPLSRRSIGEVTLMASKFDRLFV